MIRESLEWTLKPIPKLYWHCTFESFIIDDDKMKMECLDFIDRYLDLPSHIFFTGPTGCGKTHIAISIYRELARRNRIGSENVKFVTGPEFLLRIRRTFNPGYTGNETEGGIIDEYSEAELLILDDLGSEKTSEFAVQSLYLLIDRRIRNVKPMIVTTNLSLDQIEEKLDARIASRLQTMKIVEINLPDYRKKRVCRESRI